MNTPKPFIYEPKGYTVSVNDVRDLVRHGSHCHKFRVNPRHEGPSHDRLSGIIHDLDFSAEDGDAFLLQEALKEALSAADQGRYGVGAVLAHSRDDMLNIVARARNERIKGQKHEFTGHAEMRLVDTSTKYLQRKEIDHKKDIAGVNLCPCPGCFGHMIDAHYPEVVIGSIDPHVGAAFLKGRNLEIAAGDARAQVKKDRGLVYRLADIEDEKLYALLSNASWDVFHMTRKKVHTAVHAGRLTE